MNTNDPFKILQQLTVGFESLFEDLEIRKPQSFPKYNIYKEKDGRYIVEIALAGYKQEEIKVSVVNDLLIVKSDIKDKEEENNKNYLAKNIAKRNFNFNLPLSNMLKVTGANMADGMLQILLEEDKDVIREVKINID